VDCALEASEHVAATRSGDATPLLK
jgi:hypothetical protein